MKIKDRAKPKTPPIDPGVYIAVCVGVVDLGEQYSEKFKNYANKLMFIWELPGELIEVEGEQKPRQLSKEFAFSVSKRETCVLFSPHGTPLPIQMNPLERSTCLTSWEQAAKCLWR